MRVRNVSVSVAQFCNLEESRRRGTTSDNLPQGFSILAAKSSGQWKIESRSNRLPSQNCEFLDHRVLTNGLDGAISTPILWPRAKQRIVYYICCIVLLSCVRKWRYVQFPCYVTLHVANKKHTRDTRWTWSSAMPVPRDFETWRATSGDKPRRGEVGAFGRVSCNLALGFRILQISGATHSTSVNCCSRNAISCYIMLRIVMLRTGSMCCKCNIWNQYPVG